MKKGNWVISIEEKNITSSQRVTTHFIVFNNSNFSRNLEKEFSRKATFFLATKREQENYFLGYSSGKHKHTLEVDIRSKPK